MSWESSRSFCGRSWYCREADLLPPADSEIVAEVRELDVALALLVLLLLLLPLLVGASVEEG
jgi:hypothetical protein